MLLVLNYNQSCSKLDSLQSMMSHWLSIHSHLYLHSWTFSQRHETKNWKFLPVFCTALTKWTEKTPFWFKQHNSEDKITFLPVRETVRVFQNNNDKMEQMQISTLQVSHKLQQLTAEIKYLLEILLYPLGLFLISLSSIK